MTAVLLGDKELDRKLRKLGEKSSEKAIVAGIRASMRPIATAMRREINQAIADPELKQEARKTIGARFGKAFKRSNVREAKVGFAVGKKHKKLKQIGGGESRGVGVSARNIHWFVLGTDEREHKSGRPTGKIAAVFSDVTSSAFAASKGKMLAAARKAITRVIEREARKRG